MPVRQTKEVKFLREKAQELEAQLKAFRLRLEEGNSQPSTEHASKTAPTTADFGIMLKKFYATTVEQRNSRASPLLRLPAELRNRIFALVIGQEKTVLVWMHGRTNHWERPIADPGGSSVLNRQELRPALLRASRQIRRETIAVFYSTTVFMINMAETRDFDLLGKNNFAKVEAWLRKIAPVYQRLMRLGVSVYTKRQFPLDTKSLLTRLFEGGHHDRKYGLWFGRFFIKLERVSTSVSGDRDHYHIHQAEGSEIKSWCPYTVS